MKDNRMVFTDVLRLIAASALAGAVLCGCQGDDSTFPLPDAGSDAHSDATAPHDGATEASTDAARAADGPGETGAQGESGDGSATSEPDDDAGQVDGGAVSDAGDASTD